MRYVDNTNCVYNANNKTDLAEELYKSSWSRVHATSKEDWYASCANRIHEQYGYSVRYYDPIAFVDDLIENNLIMEIH